MLLGPLVASLTGNISKLKEWIELKKDLLELSRIQKICQSSILMLLDLMGFLQEFYYLQQGMGNM